MMRLLALLLALPLLALGDAPSYGWAEPVYDDSGKYAQYDGTYGKYGDSYNAGYNNAGYNNAGYNNGYNAGYNGDTSGQGYTNGYDYTNGYNNAGYNNAGYNNAGYNNAGYNNAGYNNAGYNNAGYNNGAYNNGYNNGAYNNGYNGNNDAPPGYYYNNNDGSYNNGYGYNGLAPCYIDLENVCTCAPQQDSCQIQCCQLQENIQVPDRRRRSIALRDDIIIEITCLCCGCLEIDCNSTTTINQLRGEPAKKTVQDEHREMLAVAREYDPKSTRGGPPAYFSKLNSCEAYNVEQACDCDTLGSGCSELECCEAEIDFFAVRRRNILKRDNVLMECVCCSCERVDCPTVFAFDDPLMIG